ncbi:glycosyltransferase [Litoribacter ruber]|uniref:glycosyltransferase n=1 Tax=Litoribacter ruber TaxID=702568 RepID=UPI001BD98897|nr:glycosyltransferase [Litoribacter ruber]MBT0811046.1 glycosyltransferase [Litoribacter ruber]
MAQILVITPVKDALENTLQTAKAISASSLELEHVIYNDFSSQETRRALEENSGDLGYRLVNLEDVVDTPSPNYKVVLQMAQKEALKRGLPLVVVESDVEVKQHTLKQMLDFSKLHKNSGLIGAITVNFDGEVNFPYLKFKDVKEPVVKTTRSLSFCCTLFTPEFMGKYDFKNLDNSKDWYDTFMSYKSVELGFDNFILMETPVLHKPHGSRPWKMLKYSNPIKYYWKKFWGGKDKI